MSVKCLGEGGKLRRFPSSSPSLFLFLALFPFLRPREREDWEKIVFFKNFVFLLFRKMDFSVYL